MNQILAAATVSLILTTLKLFEVIDVSWMLVGLPIVIIGILMYLANVVYRAAFFGVVHALKEIGMVELDEDEVKKWLDNRNG